MIGIWISVILLLKYDGSKNVFLFGLSKPGPLDVPTNYSPFQICLLHFRLHF